MTQSQFADTTRIMVQVPGAAYPIVIEEGLLKRAGQVLREFVGGRKVFILSDTTVWKLYGKELLQSLAPYVPAEPPVILIQPGEQHKRLTTVDKITEQLAANGTERSSLLIVIGGGVVGDMGGFVASIFLRGIDCIQIPTTLLAQVDSAIGGKTGVNLGMGKNLVGTFSQPRMVLTDPQFLKTLPERELRAGLFESIKCAVIGDRDLFEFLSVARKSVLSGNTAALTHVVRASAGLKAHVVSRDEKEGDFRRVLNFGHTIGHALEAATDYRRFLHGEAVAWGMLAATRLAYHQKMLTGAEQARIAKLITEYGPVPSLGKLDPSSLAKHMGVDKKVRDGKIHFVLPRHIGEVVIVGGIDAAQAVSALEEVVRENPFSPPVKNGAKSSPPTGKTAAQKSSNEKSSRGSGKGKS